MFNFIDVEHDPPLRVFAVPLRASRGSQLLPPKRPRPTRSPTLQKSWIFARMTKARRLPGLPRQRVAQDLRVVIFLLVAMVLLEVLLAPFLTSSRVALERGMIMLMFQ